MPRSGGFKTSLAVRSQVESYDVVLSGLLIYIYTYIYIYIDNICGGVFCILPGFMPYVYTYIYIYTHTYIYIYKSGIRWRLKAPGMQPPGSSTPRSGMAWDIVQYVQ